jgi:hypothetical protein
LLKIDINERSNDEKIAPLKMGEKCILKMMFLVLEFLDHEIYEIRRSAAMIMHSVDPEDTYTIDINQK